MPNARNAGAVLILAFAFLTGCGSSSTTGDGSTQDSPDGNLTSQMPASPVTDRLVECMRGAGWKVTRSWTSGIQSESMPNEQMSSYQDAFSKCEVESGWKEINVLTPTQVDELYNQEVTEHGCLMKQGVESDTPPSLQKYRDAYGTADQYLAMMPGLLELSEAQTRKVVEKCPPPNWYMNLKGK